VLAELLPRIPMDRRRLGSWRRLARGEPWLDAGARAGSGRARVFLGLLLMGAPRRHASAALAHLGIAGAPARGLLSLTARVAALQRALRRVPHPARPSRVARLCAAADADALIAAWCCAEPRVRRLIGAYLRRWRAIRPEVGGADLRRLGIPPGPIYGAILKRLRDLRLDGAFVGLPRRAGREAELRIAGGMARLT
jgi:tRNA nucleotidyltransferase (CCA-adding enzyme)